MGPGCVPKDWRDSRAIFELAASRDAPGLEFVDLVDLETRTLARALYATRDDEGSPIYAGLRYTSRYEGGEECWAIFDHFPVEVVRQSPIPIDEESMLAAAKALGVRIF